MDKTEILNFLKSNKEFLEKNMGVTSIALFGSYARGAENKTSDIDILVELKEPKYESLYKLQIFLENRFHHKIDIVRKGSHLGRDFLKSIEKEIAYA